ncbi:GNAT family N-acetyltransferase [Paractinoplanes rishiriensis]|uniref:N-acetyltransferase domain-containing protein n=1 Tax=Paractinoplanes rishiriensis TaxID=1050105 RepID=A0A919K2E3_9ACTN|nr:GNAT family N-acetyltransferase [Actinoplanes rishiriensis]GIE97579.1 hypothetical protein Ari01nite_50440 [Actinoplanes rishiriensis]
MISDLGDSDLAGCAALYAETFSAPPWNESWSVPDAVQRLADLLATPRAYGVSIFDGELLGFALGNLERVGAEDHFCLREMCVRPGRRREGLGTALLDGLAARLPGVRQWYLLTARDSGAAAFYERNGFRPAQRIGVFVRP